MMNMESQMTTASVPLRLGTRGSALARWQAEWVAARLQERGVAVELVPITTQGDMKTGPLGQIGGQGLFTKEIQRALLDGKIDLAVHSLKDLPTTLAPELTIAVITEREDPHDALLASGGANSLAELRPSAIVGTSSLRRQSQLHAARPDLQLRDLRGNVDTRLRKFDDGEYDAIILAAAGLRRLGLADRITSLLPFEVMLPAIGQGALGIETRADDVATNELLNFLNHEPTRAATLSERALLRRLGGGCQVPIAAVGDLSA